MGGDDSQKLLALERNVLLSGAQTSGSLQNQHSNATAYGLTNSTPHELAHALMAYFLGKSCPRPSTQKSGARERSEFQLTGVINSATFTALATLISITRDRVGARLVYAKIIPWL
jgi:hypothetical protein